MVVPMNGIGSIDLLSNSAISKSTGTNSTLIKTASSDKTEAFDNLFQAAMSMIKETNQLENNANTEEMKYSLGLSDNAHDLQIAQQKANIAIQYTVAIRNNVIDAYKQIMNLQF